MGNYLKYIGLKRDTSETVSVQNFVPASNIKVAQRYLDYLKELNDYQSDRRTTIEGKNSQLVGQASIVTSIFSLFIPLLIDKFNDLPKWISISISTLFLLVLTHYLLTILHSIRTLKIDKYRYPIRNTSTVTKENRATSEINFMNEEIKDLIYIINKSTPIDNEKGQNLIFATRCFEIANIGFGVLSLAIIIFTFFLKKEIPEVKVKNFDEIHLILPDKVNNPIMRIRKIDSTKRGIDSFNKKK